MLPKPELMGPELETKATTVEYFGGCSHCGKAAEYTNVRSDHWFFFHDHKTKWRIGSNLFSSWCDEIEKDWTRNRYRLTGYMAVDRIHRKPSQ